MLKASTIQLLRIPFSFFLMPIYWFALSQVSQIDTVNAIAIFIILHLLAYPASNAYNSFMDKDTESIGGVQKPLAPTKQLLYTSWWLNVLALVASVFISYYFMLLLLLYIAASTAYSHRGIRLKKYPILSYVLAIVFQGAVVYFMVAHGSGMYKPLDIAWPPMLVSSLMVGSFYPLTQVYQHKQDAEDGVTTMSILLGYRGTFKYCIATYSLLLVLMCYYFAANLELDRFLVFAACTLPTLVYFIWWFYKVIKDTTAANFKNAMRMNWIAASCSNVAFFIIFLMREKF